MRAWTVRRRKLSIEEGEVESADLEAMNHIWFSSGFCYCTWDREGACMANGAELLRRGGLVVQLL